MSRIELPLLSVLMVVGTIFTFTVHDAGGFQNEALARMVFWHLPCALICSAFAFAAPYFSFRYLQTRDRAWDGRALACSELALVFGILTLLTGSLFAKVQWGAWWNWDPRQTSFLLAMLLLGAYFALRAAFDNPSTRAANAAVYSLVTLLPLVFLVFVYPRLPTVVSLHPVILRDGTFDADYRYVFLTMLVLMGWLGTLLYRLRVRLVSADLRLEALYAELANRDRASTPRLVRTSPVPTGSGPQDQSS